MPTYVYGCDTCGNRFEKHQRFSDEPIKVCPECESKVRRIFQPAGIVFKGSGWHINDYKRAGKAESESAKDDSTSSDGAKAGAGKDGKDSAAKPAAKESTAKESTAKESSASSGSSDSAPASPAS